MKICILPVSGGSLIHQIATLQCFSKANYIPDVYLSSSGGNVAAHIALASQLNPFTISRISGRVTSNLVLKKHSENIVLDIINKYLKGTLYNNGTGSEDFFLNIFSEETYNNTELWIGLYDKIQNKHVVICNKTESIFNIQPCNYVKFRNSCISDMSKYCQASASIPMLTPSVKIANNEYQDGGIAAASPLIEFIDIIRNLKCKIQMIYVTPLSKSIECNNDRKSLLREIKEVTDNMVRSSIINDEKLALSIMRSRFKKEKYYSGSGFPYELILLINDKHFDYLIFIHPKKEFSLNISKFDGEDMINGINKCAKYLNFSAYIYY